MNKTKAELESEIKELEALSRRQHRRTVKADRLWQEMNNKPGILPDLGTLIKWLLDLIDKLRTTIKTRENTLEQLYIILKDANSLSFETTGHGIQDSLDEAGCTYQSKVLREVLRGL